MIKKSIQILLILIALVFMIFGGNYVLQKQSNHLVFENFVNDSTQTQLYIPNANRYIKISETASLNDSLKFPSQIADCNNKLASLEHFDFNATVSSSIFLAYDKTKFTIGLKNYNLTINKVIQLLFSELEITAVANKNTINFNDNSIYYKKLGEYLIFSNEEIKINTNTVKKEFPFGNYDYSIKNKSNTYYKINNEALMTFAIKDSDTIKGRPVNPNQYFNVIPNSFDNMYFYGSSKFDTDKHKLLKNESNSNFYSWIDNSFILIKKDSFELIIGKQNNNQNLQDILEETTLSLSKDSLLPTPLFKNNFEINFFESNYDWQSILPASNQQFKIYSEYNNFNILASSLSAMHWYITEIQLGNTFKPLDNNLYIPSKTHTLKINKTNTNSIINTKNWINKSTCLESTSYKAAISKSNNNIQLESQFTPSFKPNDIKNYFSFDSLYTLISNPNNVAIYNIKGDQVYNWTSNELLIQPPTVLTLNNSIYILFYTANKLSIIDVKTKQNITGMPKSFSNYIRHITPIKYDENSDYRLLIEFETKISNFDINGKVISDWNEVTLNSGVRNHIKHQSINKIDYLYYIDSNDSLQILDRKGNIKFDKKIIVPKTKHSINLSGSPDKNNLRILSFASNQIQNHFIKQPLIDSIDINIKTNPVNTFWTFQNGQNMLIIEEFNRVLFVNQYGLIESDLTKPKHNTSLLNKKFDDNKLYIFGNLTNNELYLLNKFGAQINSAPINGSQIFDQNESYLTTFYNGQILIYQY